MPLSCEAIKQYKILNLIGRGGMGEVYLAHDAVLDRKVAIKVLPEKFEKDAHSRMRFLREAKAAAALDHPFICKVYETGECNDKAYIVMEYIEGQPLDERLEKEPLHMKEALDITLEIAEALEKAHTHQIIHRDLKPANIMLTPQGHVKVMDFGLAKWVAPKDEDDLAQTIQDVTQKMTLTEEGAIAGTLAYMSPEQARGKPLDARSDIFSLGLIFYEMTAGRHPFIKTSGIETLSAILRDSTPHTQIKPKSLNPLLAPIFRKALAKDVANRYQNVKEFINDLKKTQRELIGGSKFMQRGLPIIAGSVLIAAVLSFFGLHFLKDSRIATPDSGPAPKTVLISDFQNRTGDPVFDGSIEPALQISLEGASFISIYDRVQARKLITEIDPSSDGRLSVDNSQLISVREGINLIVDALIEPKGNGYTITLWAINPINSKSVFKATRNIDKKSDVLVIAERLASELRSNLGEAPADSAADLARETFTATSLEAMKSYAEAQEKTILGQDDEAIKVYLRAIEEDPNMGRAYAGLAVIYRNRGDYETAKNYYEKAMSLLDHMTDRERFRTRGGYYFINRNFKKAIEEISALRERYPLDSASFTNLPLAYFYARDMQRALEEGRLAVETYPGRLSPQFNLVWYAIGAGDFEMAEEEARKTLEINADFPDIYVCLGLIHLAEGRIPEAKGAYSHIESFDNWGVALAANGLSDLALYEGRLSEAVKILENGIKKDLENGFNANAVHKQSLLAEALMQQGKQNESLTVIDASVEGSKKESILFMAAQIYIQAGQENKALGIADTLNGLLQPEPQAYAQLISAQIQLKQNNPTAAISLIQEAQALVDTWIGHLILGQAYLTADAYTEAYSEFETCLDRIGEVTSLFLDDMPSMRYYPQIHYYLGRAQEGLKSPAAKESYQKFLDIKKNADGDQMVQDARDRFTNTNPK